MGPDTGRVVRNRVIEKSFRIATADSVRVSNLREAAVTHALAQAATLTLSLNIISTLAEAALSDYRMSVIADGQRRCGLGWAIGRTPAAEAHASLARVSPRARISGGRPFALGRSFPLVVVAAPRL